MCQGVSPRGWENGGNYTQIRKTPELFLLSRNRWISGFKWCRFWSCLELYVVRGFETSHIRIMRVRLNCETCLSLRENARVWVFHSSFTLHSHVAMCRQVSGYSDTDMTRIGSFQNLAQFETKQKFSIPTMQTPSSHNSKEIARKKLFPDGSLLSSKAQGEDIYGCGWAFPDSSSLLCGIIFQNWKCFRQICKRLQFVGFWGKSAGAKCGVDFFLEFWLWNKGFPLSDTETFELTQYWLTRNQRPVRSSRDEKKTKFLCLSYGSYVFIKMEYLFLCAISTQSVFTFNCSRKHRSCLSVNN